MIDTVQFPPDDELERLAQLLRPAMVARLVARQKRTRRRRISAIAGSAALVAGVAVAAATLAPVANPDDAVSIVGPGGSVFAIDCFSSANARAAVIQYSTAADANTAVKNPAGVCTTTVANGAEEDAVDAKAAELTKSGLRCGRITVTGLHTWIWDSDGKGGIGSTDGTNPPGTPVCATNTPVIIPGPPPVPTFTACARAANWAVVYPLGKSSASAVCSSHGYQVWGE